MPGVGVSEISCLWFRKVFFTVFATSKCEIFLEGKKYFHKEPLLEIWFLAKMAIKKYVSDSFLLTAFRVLLSDDHGGVWVHVF